MEDTMRTAIGGEEMEFNLVTAKSLTVTTTRRRRQRRRQQSGLASFHPIHETIANLIKLGDFLFVFISSLWFLWIRMIHSQIIRSATTGMQGPTDHQAREILSVVAVLNEFGYLSQWHVSPFWKVSKSIAGQGKLQRLTLLEGSIWHISSTTGNDCESRI